MWFWLLGSSLLAQVSASLISSHATVRPGQELWFALRLEHAPQWHTYWSNPGTGLPTQLEWLDTAGLEIDAFEWPAPGLVHDVTGAISGQGYEGIVLFPIRVRVPDKLALGTELRLQARASWLMCKEACVPGAADLALSLKVGAVGEVSQASLIEASLARLPAQASRLQVTAWRAGAKWLLELRDPTGQPLPTLRFFPASEWVNYEGEQTVVSRGPGLLRLQIPLLDSPEAQALTQVTGVLVPDQAWPLLEGREGLSLSVDLAAAPQVSPAASAGVGLWATLGLALLGGLILNLMPCVFPVLGIKILGFVQQAGADRRKVVGHGLVFTLGVLLSFWTLAAGLLLLRSGGAQLGWGFQLQSPGFVLALTLVMLGFALNMSGLFEFGLSATSLGSGLQSKEGYLGSFFTGVLATVVATPCSAPFLAPALGAALALPPLASLSVFTAIGVGLSAPYLILSLFPQLVKLLPRPGAWMETFRQLMAFPLYATVAYLVWVLAAQVEDEAFLSILLGLVLLATALWDYGRHAQPHGAKRPRLALARSLLVGLLAVWLAWPQSKAPGEPVWEAWSPERVEALRAQKRTIYVDFTARWCATCQANKKAVFGSARVREFLRENQVVLLRADWTNRDPQITEALTSWERSAVPFNLIYLPDASEPKVLPELLTPDIVLDALKAQD